MKAFAHLQVNVLKSISNLMNNYVISNDSSFFKHLKAILKNGINNRCDFEVDTCNSNRPCDQLKMIPDPDDRLLSIYAWSNWGECSATCGKATRSRHLVCEPEGSPTSSTVLGMFS